MTASRRHPYANTITKLALDVPPLPDSSMGKLVRKLNAIVDEVNSRGVQAIQAYDSLPAPHADSHLQGGADPLDAPATPLTVTVGGSASAGSGPAYMLENAQLVVSAGAALGLANANANGSAGTGSRGDHQHKRDVRVKDVSGDVGTRNALKLLAGTAITRTVTDSAGSDLVSDTVAVTGAPTVAGQLWTYASGAQGVVAAPAATGQVLTADTTLAAKMAWSTPSTLEWVPLTDVVAGVPGFVWDADNQLVMTQVTP